VVVVGLLVAHIDRGKQRLVERHQRFRTIPGSRLRLRCKQAVVRWNCCSTVVEFVRSVGMVADWCTLLCRDLLGSCLAPIRYRGMAGRQHDDVYEPRGRRRERI